MTIHPIISKVYVNSVSRIGYLRVIDIVGHSGVNDTTSSAPTGVVCGPSSSWTLLRRLATGFIFLRPTTDDGGGRSPVGPRLYVSLTPGPTTTDGNGPLVVSLVIPFTSVGLVSCVSLIV